VNVEGEPSNAELREMLIDIQINIATNLHENKSIRSEMIDLKCTIQQQKDDITALKTSLEHTTRQNVTWRQQERNFKSRKKKSANCTMFRTN